VDSDALKRSALVVSPHQDDETLGCGGTIVSKRRAGAEVTIVFLMDGHRSHTPHIEPAELSALRHSEAVAAAERMGVGRDHVVFLDLLEGKLGLFVDEAVERLGAVLSDVAPEEVFLPAALEPKKEHAIANAVGRGALDRWGHEVTVYEYPVWCWYHWPRVPLPFTRRTVGPASRTRYELPRVLSNTRLMSYGARMYREFTTRIDVGDSLEDKRAALAEHRSQMTRLRPDRPWATLSDVGGGEFLDCFFTGDEVFRRYVYRPAAQSAPSRMEGPAKAPA